MTDLEVLQAAMDEQRVLITNDRDFGELIFRRRLPHAGVILFRLQSVAFAAKRAALATVLRDFPDQLDAFLVVTEGGIRIRRVSPR